MQGGNRAEQGDSEEGKCSHGRPGRRDLMSVGGYINRSKNDFIRYSSIFKTTRLVEASKKMIGLLGKE